MDTRTNDTRATQSGLTKVKTAAHAKCSHRLRLQSGRQCKADVWESAYSCSRHRQQAADQRGEQCA
jgi:hypothetical protein